MRLVEVDAVGLQPAQRGLRSALHVILARAAAFAHVLAELGGDHDLVALAARFQPFADNGFQFAADMPRRPARIAVGGVDGVEAGIDKGVEDGERGLGVDVPAEHIAAQHQRRNADVGLAEGAECAMPIRSKT